MPLLRSLYGAFQSLRDPDKEKREALQRLLMADPTAASRLQQLSPDLLQQLTGRNPSLFNKNASTKLQESIQNNPLDPITASRIEQARTAGEVALKQRGALNAVENEGQPSNIARNPLESFLGQKNLSMPVGTSPNRAIVASDDNKDVVAGLLGTPTVQQKKNDELRGKSITQDLLLGDQNLKKGEIDLQRGAIDVQTAQGNLSKAQTEAADKARKATNSTEILTEVAKSGRKLTDLYKDPNWRAKIIDSNTYDQFDKDRNAEYEGRRLAIMQDTKKSGIEQAEIQNAQNLATFAGVSVASAQKVLSDPKLRDELTNEKTPPTDPARKELWEATTALNSRRDSREIKSQIPAASAEFQKLAGPLLNQIRSGKGANGGDITPAEMPGIVADVNRIAAATFGPLGLELEYGFGKEGDTNSKVWREKVPFITKASEQLIPAGYKPIEKKPKVTNNPQDITSPTTTEERIDFGYGPSSADDIFKQIKDTIDLQEAINNPKVTPTFRKRLLELMASKKK